MSTAKWLIDDKKVSDMGQLSIAKEIFAHAYSYYKASSFYREQKEIFVLKNRKKIIVLVCIGIVVLIFWIGFLIVFWGIDVEVKKDVKEYGDFSEFLGYSNLMIFPEVISGEVQEAEYYYYNRDAFMDPVCQVYLKCKYDEKHFTNERNRLAEIKCEYNGRKNSVKYDKESFSYPVFVTINNWNSCNEYAVLDESENTIIYVFSQGIPSYRMKVPQKYRYSDRKTDNYGSFSIYSFDGYLEMKYR